MTTREEAIEAAGEVYGAILANPERREQLRQAREAKAAAERPAEDPPGTVRGPI